MPEGEYLRNVSYEVLGGKHVKWERDHNAVIGYDDINQAFWSPEGISRIQLEDKTRLVDVHIGKRWTVLNKVNWDSAFRKTYIEKRTWLHLAVNFTRIWIIHVVSFWYFTAWNVNFLYMDEDMNEDDVQYSVVALRGAIATLFMLLGVVCEFMFIPLTWSNSSMLIRRLIILTIVLIINAGPSVYVCLINRTGTVPKIIGIVQYRNLCASMFARSLRCPCSLAILSWVMSSSSYCSRSV
ncbi:MAG: hypothetical protein J3Q66DRAFT_371934 [Benniella sp.]|nr:MAG: hypothetical protein J3Q66DRAFT_371934 [Benniella sp.]